MLNNRQQFWEQIKKAKNILITFPAEKNGEAIAGALALKNIFSGMGKENEIVTQPGENKTFTQKTFKTFSFLPGFERINTSSSSLKRFIISLDLSNTSVRHVKYKMEKNSLKFLITPKEGAFASEDITSESANINYDLIITLNTPDPESLGKIYEENAELFYNTPIVNIDNDSANEEFGEINLVELTAASTAEIIFDLFKEEQENLIGEEAATCLLAAIIHKTKNFKTADITPNVLKITSELISLGGKREEILNELYRSRGLNTLKLWGRVLARLSGTKDNKIIWSGLLQQDFIKTGSVGEELPDIIDELITNIPGAEITAIFYEDPSKRDEAQEERDIFTSVIVYSAKNIDLTKEFKDYSPERNNKLTRLKINAPIQEAKKEIIDLLQRKIKELSL
ncbi:MAG: DHH family phosphoesterase [Patescibacteria group bacterium]